MNMFKVGDRVVRLRQNGKSIPEGAVGTVTKTNTGYCDNMVDVEFDHLPANHPENNKRNYCENLELVQPERLSKTVTQTEYEAWCSTYPYSGVERIKWLLNMARTLEAKNKGLQETTNNLYSIIKQQQAKANELSSRTAAVHPDVVHLQKEAAGYKEHISTLNAEITNLRTAFHEQQRRLSVVYDATVGNIR